MSEREAVERLTNTSEREQRNRAERDMSEREAVERLTNTSERESSRATERSELI